jgi:hypothetical protein
MFARWFLAHPREVGESYSEHFRMAAGFAFRLVGGGLACLVHALVPCLFQTTASRTVAQLHGSMTARRKTASAPLTGGSNGPRQVIVRAD